MAKKPNLHAAAPRTVSTDGLVNVVSGLGTDKAKRDIMSPNIADSFIIANSRGLLARRTASEIL